MPIFQCPKCSRVGYVPMAACDEVLLNLPLAPDGDKILVECVDCETKSTTLNEPVKWYPPNCRFADD